MGAPVRYDMMRDEHVTRWLHRIIVECPRCGEPALSRGITDDLRDRKLTCTRCGHARQWRADIIRTQRQPVDPFSDDRLFLRSDTADGPIYAFNERHLRELTLFVGATLREREPHEWGWRNSSYFSRLPKWMKASGNRTMILQHLHRLQALAAREGFAPPNADHSVSTGV